MLKSAPSSMPLYHLDLSRKAQIPTSATILSLTPVNLRLNLVFLFGTTSNSSSSSSSSEWASSSEESVNILVVRERVMRAGVGRTEEAVGVGLARALPATREGAIAAANVVRRSVALGLNIRLVYKANILPCEVHVI